MPTIRRFEEIEAWQTARELTRLVYSITEEGKFAKDFGLKDQIRRACVSIMSNIAEGFESKTQPAFIRYLGIAKASAGEVRAQLYVANDVKYLSDEQFAQLFDIAEKSSRQLSRFISYLEAQPNTYRVKDESPEYET
ncbi:MAG TPA: four helix bundle protein [Anaerolineales bacterium]|nr:four helix bundle protein [Anaerolineales bacterium]HNA56051.1 four helix bundle protein [Anaerolineales bacterium]HNB88718.1 four helix bundle protein [Anaerolineales bacterium]HND92330.1 four helix bundle protein [Anaerolineales bacterium]